MSHFSRIIRQAVASWGWRLSAGRRRPGCLVLLYHRVGSDRDPFPHLGVDEFRRQLAWLASNCRVVGAAELPDAIRQPSGTSPPVLLTFDDGYRDYHDVAYPVLKQFGMPAVVFPISDYLDHPRLLPWDRLYLAVHRARVDQVSLSWLPVRRLGLGRSRRDRFIRDCKGYLNQVPDDRKAHLVDELVLALDAAPFEVRRQTMTWDEVRATLDLTTYGGHTHTHPRLSTINSARLEYEIRTCRDRIDAETGVRPTLFAYPHGEITPEARAMLPRYGFGMAFSTVPGFNDETTDWLDVKRLGVKHVVPTGWMTAKSWTLARAPVAPDSA